MIKVIPLILLVFGALSCEGAPSSMLSKVGSVIKDKFNSRFPQSFPDFNVVNKDKMSDISVIPMLEGVQFFIPAGEVDQFSLQTSKENLIINEFQFEFNGQETTLTIKLQPETLIPVHYVITAKVLPSENPKNDVSIQPISIEEVQTLMTTPEACGYKKIQLSTNWISDVLKKQTRQTKTYKDLGDQYVEYSSTSPLKMDEEILKELTNLQRT